MGKGMPTGQIKERLRNLSIYSCTDSCGADKREIAEPLNIFMYRFSSFLDRREELVYDHLGVILIKSSEKSCFQVNPRINGAGGKAPKPIKGYPLKGTDE